MQTEINQNIKDILLNERYYVTPFNPNDFPIISFLICCRVLRGVEDKNSLYALFNSIMEIKQKQYPSWESDSNSRTNLINDLKKIEFIIKFDIDDDVAINNWVIGNTLKQKYPFLTIRPIVYGRWEGRRSISEHYRFIFSRRNTNAKWIGFLTDDVIFMEDPLKEIEKYKDEKYAILTHVHNLEVVNKIKDWVKETTSWSNGNMTEPYPMCTANLIEITGNMGWGLNVDNWLAGLNVILIKKYGIDIYKDIIDVFHRTVFEAFEFNPKFFLPSQFNKEFFVDDSEGSKDPYYYKLLETQADNIYFHLKRTN